jgi:hypothetical protein
VRSPGREWLETGRAGTPGYWRRAARELRDAFQDRCGYTAMFLSTPGTVDHFVSRSEDRNFSYEWSNLRYAAAWINSSKNNLPSSSVLDPFEVGDDWFEVILRSWQMVLTEHCPAEYRERAMTMLTWLQLRDGESVVRYRRAWLRMHVEHGLSLEGLAEKAPLLARAVMKARACEAQRDEP